MKRLLGGSLGGLFVLLTAARAIAAADPFPYRPSWVIPGRLLRSGAIVVDGDHLATDTPHDRAEVARALEIMRRDAHVGAVVNLRAESAEDEDAAHKLGMPYLHLPIVDGHAPTPEEVTRFFRFLAAERDRVTWVHCAGGIGRTGVLCGMVRLQAGWKTRPAVEEMFRLGLNYPQAQEHLPALNAFAADLGRTTYFPADWSGPREAPQPYQGLRRKLPTWR